MIKKVAIIILASFASLLIWRVELFFEVIYHQYSNYKFIFSFLLIGITLVLTRFYKTPIKGAGIFWLKSHLEHQLFPISLKDIWQYLLSLLASLSALVPLGREAPTVTIGGAIGSVLGEKSDHNENIKLGIVAAFAAAFRAPIAGMFFLYEVLMHRGQISSLKSKLLWSGSFLGFAIAGSFVGFKKAFDVPHIQFFNIKLIILSLFFSTFVGVTSAYIFKYFFKIKKLFFKLSHEENHLINLILLHLKVLVLFYFVMFFSPEAIGSGMEIVVSLIQGKFHSLNITVLIFLVRASLLLLFYSLTFPGGTFVPFLALGSLIGAIFSLGISQFIVLDQGQMIWFVLLGVATFFAAMMHAPLTISILLLEMSWNLKLLPFLLFFSYHAFYLKRRLHQTEFYHF